jgi:hypothetical protein
MYWTGENPFTGQPCFVEKDNQARERQKAVLTGPSQGNQGNSKMQSKEQIKGQGGQRSFAKQKRSNAATGPGKKGKFSPRKKRG